MKKLFAQIVKFGIVGFISFGIEAIRGYRADCPESCDGADFQLLL